MNNPSPTAGDALLARFPASHRYRLPSGRVLLLSEPFTEEELAGLQTPEGIAAFERHADEMERRGRSVPTS